MSSTTEESKEQKLSAQSELRLDVDTGKTAFVKLIEGTAEVFGTELAKEKEYEFSDQSVGVFTWHGCTLSIRGESHSYVSSETPMVHYANLHAVFDEQRKQALKNETAGPKIIIVGPTDAGKSTLSRILLNYCSRRGYQPTFVDLDVGQGSISVPGAIAAAPLFRPLDVSSGFGDLSSPMALFYGDNTPGSNPKLYRQKVDQLAEIIENRFKQQKEANAAGMIINTCGWTDGVGYELILHCIGSLHADHVIVVGDERLFNDISQSVKSINNDNNDKEKNDSHNTVPNVVYAPRSGGVKQRSTNLRRTARSSKIREYFYGSDGSLAPHSTTLRDVQFCRVGGGPQAPSSALPIGAERKLDPAALTECDATPDMLNSIGAVSFATEFDQVATSPVAGFVHIQNVNEENGKVKVLTPCAGPLPGRFIIVGDIKWIE